MGSVLHTDKATVLRRFAALLRTANTSIENRVFILNEEDSPRENLRDRDLVTVQMRGGTFDWAAMSGGRAMPYQGTITVTIWMNDRRDRQSTGETLQLGEGGLFELERDILRTMFQSSLDEGIGEEPATCILSDPVKPVGDSAPQRAIDEPYGDDGGGRTQHRGVLAIDFGVGFHWDLS